MAGISVGAGKIRATWQIIGQQVLMGKLIMPVLDEDAIDTSTLSERYRKRLESLRQIGEAGLPMNLDAWDGYPVCRERIHAVFKQFASNPVVLAGDTHNGWAFNMRDAKGMPLVLRLNARHYESRYMEAYLPAPPAMMQQALKASSEELYDLDTSRRGWTHIELHPRQQLDMAFRLYHSREYLFDLGEHADCLQSG